MRTTILSLALLGMSAIPAVACEWGKAKMTVAEVPSVPMTTGHVPAPVEVALRDVWLERMLG